MGRPASFDREQVVESATDLFWRQGYLSTSVSDLVAATRLNPGSLYNTFESKQGVLLESIAWYGKGSRQRAARFFSDPVDIYLACRDFFQYLIELMLEDPDAKGCLLVNTWMEAAQHEEEVRHALDVIFAEVEQKIRTAFIKAKQQGQLKADTDPAALAKYVMNTVWGLRVMGRMKPSRAEFEQVVGHALQAIEMNCVKAS